MNVLDLFSGIGGFSVGLERAGMRTVAFCEIDPYCRAVLAKHWPGVPIFEDIRGLDANRLARLGPLDVICGGFPCQPWSLAGKRKGQNDNRNLWPEMFRVVSLARPAWVLFENVAGLVSMALDDLLAQLESIGYSTRPFVIPACGVGAPHRRDRLWIVAKHSSAPDAHVADAGCSRLSIPEQTFVPRSRRRKERRTAPECGRWAAEPGLGRVAYGIPNRVDRLSSLGNAVVPQIPEIIGRAIMSASGR